MGPVCVAGGYRNGRASRGKSAQGGLPGGGRGEGDCSHRYRSAGGNIQGGPRFHGAGNIQCRAREGGDDRGNGEGRRNQVNGNAAAIDAVHGHIAESVRHQKPPGGLIEENVGRYHQLAVTGSVTADVGEEYRSCRGVDGLHRTLEGIDHVHPLEDRRRVVGILEGDPLGGGETEGVRAEGADGPFPGSGFVKKLDAAGPGVHNRHLLRHLLEGDAAGSGKFAVRRAEGAEFLHEGSGGVKDLHAVVETVGHVDGAVVVHRYAIGHLELTGTGAQHSNLRAGGIIHGHEGPLPHEQRAVGCNGNTLGRRGGFHSLRQMAIKIVFKNPFGKGIGNIDVTQGICRNPQRRKDSIDQRVLRLHGRHRSGKRHRCQRNNQTRQEEGNGHHSFRRSE
jgi:hypothetical protein